MARTVDVRRNASRLWPARVQRLMDPERFRQVERLYHAALEQEEGQRSRFLEEACAGDSALRREVESLLARDAATSLIDTPAIEVAAKALADESHWRNPSS